MGLLHKLLVDDHPERDETHASTRYGVYEPEVVPGLPPAQDTRAQRFDEFDKAHPEIFAAICERARTMKYEQIFRGVETPRLSMKAIFEELRGRFGRLELNNSYTPFYTDKLIAKYPEYEANFERRRRATKQMRLVNTRQQAY